MWLGWRRAGLGRLLRGFAGVEPLELRRPPRSAPRTPSAPPPPPGAFGLPLGLMSRACVLRPKLPTQRPAPESPQRVGGGAQEGRRAGGVCGGVGVRGWRCRRCDAAARPVPDQPTRCRGCCRIQGAAATAGGPPESGGRGDTHP